MSDLQATPTTNCASIILLLFKHAASQWIGTWEDAGKICSPDLWDVAKPTCTTSICYSWCNFHLLPCNLEHSKPIIIWKKTITSRAWCKAVKLNSAPHQFTSASAEGLESLNFPSSNKTMNLIHVHMYWQYWYIYIRFNFHILGILRPSFQAIAPCLCWKKSLGNVWVVQPRCFKQWRWLVVLLGLCPSNSDRAWDIDVSKYSGTPKWMVYNVKPYQNGWFGGKTHYFLKHPYLQINAIFDQAGPAMDLPC